MERYEKQLVEIKKSFEEDYKRELALLLHNIDIFVKKWRQQENLLEIRGTLDTLHVNLIMVKGGGTMNEENTIPSIEEENEKEVEEEGEDMQTDEEKEED